MNEPTDSKPNSPTRRDFLAGAAGTVAAVATSTDGFRKVMSESAPSSVSILHAPDGVRCFGPNGQIAMDKSGSSIWKGGGAVVTIGVLVHELSVDLNSSGVVSRIELRWKGDLRSVQRYLGDHWERSYADLEWRGEVPGRVMPWYFLTHDGKNTSGYGVKTQAGAMCFWTADAEGISLWLDVRSGGVPVELGDRTLRAATVVEVHGELGKSAFQVTERLCKTMCPNPRIPAEPIYGTNDWNYAYGKNSADLISNVSSLISDLSPSTDHRPYSVIDEGWAMGPYNGKFGHGPWEGNPRFGDMGKFAAHLKTLGVRPGIWFRPLTPLAESKESWRLTRNKEFLDPTVPEVKEHVSREIKKLVGWGYEMIKHDFTSWDLFGLWGFEMNGSPTRDGWKLHDSSRTNAEVLLDLYSTIRESAGEARLIGCNTVSHLAAGSHEVQRIGDDTSGRSWNRNRRMGVNTLAFRAAQHRNFYIADPDIVAITKDVLWSLVEQWLRLVSSSGTALFVAVEPSVINDVHRAALKKALALAAKPLPTGEPLDWMTTDCPRRWKLNGKTEEFAWMGEHGAWPFGD